MGEYIVCELPKQNWGLKPKWEGDLKFLYLLEIYFVGFGTDNMHCIFLRHAEISLSYFPQNATFFPLFNVV